MYSFDESAEAAQDTYSTVCGAYERILQRLRLPIVKGKKKKKIGMTGIFPCAFVRNNIIICILFQDCMAWRPTCVHVYCLYKINYGKFIFSCNANGAPWD